MNLIKNIASSLNNIAAVHNNIGNTEKALHVYNQSLKMFRKVNNNKLHPEIATFLNNIGAVYDKYWKY